MDDVHALKAKLDALKAEIGAKRAQLQARGVFTDAHEALLAGFEKRRAAAVSHIDQALGAGSPWGAVKGEFERDYGGMWEAWSRAVERLDAEAMKGS